MSKAMDGWLSKAHVKLSIDFAVINDPEVQEEPVDLEQVQETFKQIFTHDNRRLLSNALTRSKPIQFLGVDIVGVAVEDEVLEGKIPLPPPPPVDEHNCIPFEYVSDVN